MVLFDKQEKFIEASGVINLIYSPMRVRAYTQNIPSIQKQNWDSFLRQIEF